MTLNKAFPFLFGLFFLFTIKTEFKTSRTVSLSCCRLFITPSTVASFELPITESPVIISYPSEHTSYVIWLAGVLRHHSVFKDDDVSKKSLGSH